MKKWIVTAVDHGETCDGKARVLQVCDTEDEAKAYVRNDMESWLDERAGEGVEADFDKMEAHYDYDSDNGCSWNIEEVDVGGQKTPEAKAVDRGPGRYRIAVKRTEYYEHVEEVDAESLEDALKKVEEMEDEGRFNPYWDMPYDIDTDYAEANAE